MTIRPALLMLLPLLGACAAVKGADEPVTLRLAPRFAAAPVLKDQSISIAPVQARGVAGSQRYAYVDASAPGEVRQAKTFFWEETPPRLLEQALVDGFRSRFSKVSGPDTGFAGDRRLVVVLTRFEEMTGTDTRATTAFDVSLVEGGILRMNGRYCATAPIADASATTRAQAFGSALQASVEAVVRDVASGSLSSTDC